MSVGEYINGWSKFITTLRETSNLECMDEKKLYKIILHYLKNNDLYTKDELMNCPVILKSGIRKGECCGRKCDSKQTVCKLHITQAAAGNVKLPEIKRSEDEDSTVIIRKNQYNNFVYGNTRLIFRSIQDKSIVAKEGEEGIWLPLSDKDIETCNFHNLYYKIIDLQPKKASGQLSLAKQIQLVPKMCDKEGVKDVRREVISFTPQQLQQPRHDVNEQSVQDKKTSKRITSMDSFRFDDD